MFLALREPGLPELPPSSRLQERRVPMSQTGSKRDDGWASARELELGRGGRPQSGRAVPPDKPQRGVDRPQGCNPGLCSSLHPPKSDVSSRGSFTPGVQPLTGSPTPPPCNASGHPPQGSNPGLPPLSPSPPPPHTHWGGNHTNPGGGDIGLLTGNVSFPASVLSTSTTLSSFLYKRFPPLLTRPTCDRTDTCVNNSARPRVAASYALYVRVRVRGKRRSINE